MRLVTIVLIVVALGIAGLTAFLVNSLLSENEVQSEPQIVEEAKVEVLVAAVDLPVGRIVRVQDLIWQSWPEAAVGPDFVVNVPGQDGEVATDFLAELQGSGVRIPIVAGEPILPAKLFRQGDAGFLAGVLSPGMRAVTVGVGPETGAAGFVLPGDRVDLMIVLDAPVTDPVTGAVVNRKVSETFLEDVRVLATDQKVSAPVQAGDEAQTNATVASLAQTVTLEVTPNQAQAVAVADQIGRITLVLRSALEGELSEPRLRYSPDYMVSEFLGRGKADVPRVLVAASDIEPGTVLTDRDWRWADMPSGQAAAGWFLEGAQDVNRVKSALVVEGFAAGQPLDAAALVFPGQDSYIPSVLSPGMRALTITLDEASSVSGFVVPGSLVDVVLTYAIADGSDDPLKDPRRFGETILENVRVLHIDRGLDPATGLPDMVGASTATIEVTPEQAERVLVAGDEGDLTLVLRGNDPGTGTRLADYTSDFDVSRSMVDVVYGLALPQPPALLARSTVETPTEDQAEAFSDSEPLDFSGLMSGFGSGGTTGLESSDRRVRVFRSTTSEELRFP